MLEKGNELADQLNSYFSSNIDLLLILKSLLDLDCDIEGVLKVEADLAQVLKDVKIQDLARLRHADARIPIFKLACSGLDLKRAIQQVKPKQSKAGSIDHIFHSEV